MIAPVSVQQHYTHLDTNLPQFEGHTELWKTGISLGTKTQGGGVVPKLYFVLDCGFGEFFHRGLSLSFKV